MAKRKTVKSGVRIGGGPPPGYLWNCEILHQADDEARSFLDKEQYSHVAEQVKELAKVADPVRSDTVDVRPVEDFFEIRDKGGILGKINVRIFFFVDDNLRNIVVLGAIKKENNGQTPIGVKHTMRRRKRLYLEAFH